MLKVSENPPMIWPEQSSVADFAGVWWVAHTKSRNEKALAWQLQKKGIQYFLPMHRKMSKKKGRTYWSLLPLFPSYLFFCVAEEAERLHALTTNRIARLIEVPNKTQFVTELLAIEKVLRSGQPLLPDKYLKVGQRYRVIAGPLLGIEGHLTKVGEKTRLVLQIDMLGQAISAIVDANMVEPVTN